MCSSDLHHNSKEGARLAGEINRWLRRPTAEVWRARCGVPVYVRAEPFEDRYALPGVEQAVRLGAPDPELQIDRPPLRLPMFAGPEESGLLTFVVPIVDAEMAADPRWGSLFDNLLSELGEAHALLEPAVLARKPPTDRPRRPFVQVVPVAVDAYASQVCEKLGTFQGIAPRQWADPGEPAAAQQVRDTRLRRELYLSLIRTLRWWLTGRGGDEPVHVFLSHAKRDAEAGAGVAETLRDVTSGLGHVRAWYDATDLLPGTDWQSQLRDSAGAGTVGLIACWSDSYASRPWCLEEIRQARTPRKVRSNLWMVQPTVVVDLTGHSGDWTNAPPELGGLPVLRWSAESRSAPIDRLLFESLQILANGVHAEQLLDSGYGEAAITWSPDPATMLALWRETPAFQGRLLHPGYDGRVAGGGVASRLVPEGVRLVRFDDEAEPPKAAENGRVRVQLSIGDPGDLGPLGMLPTQAEEVAYEVALAVLGAGADILFGGQPAERRPGEGTQLTEEIAIAAMEHERPDQIGRVAAPRERVLFTVPWRGTLSAQARTMWLPVCRVVNVLPPKDIRAPGARIPDGEERAWIERVTAAADRRRNEAFAATAMRTRAAEQVRLAVLAGGKTHGFTGLMPGLAEELACLLDAERTVVLLAGFGGTARRLAQILLHSGAGSPPGLSWLTPEEHLADKSSKFTALWAELSEEERVWVSDRYAALRQRLLQTRLIPAGPGQWVTRSGPRLVLVAGDGIRSIRRLIVAEAERAA